MSSGRSGWRRAVLAAIACLCGEALAAREPSTDSSPASIRPSIVHQAPADTTIVDTTIVDATIVDIAKPRLAPEQRRRACRHCEPNGIRGLGLFDRPGAPAEKLSLQEWLGLSEAGCFVSGHIHQGVNLNGRDAINPAAGGGNSPAAGTVYRSGYLLNQVYLAMGKTADTSEEPWAIGYEVDLVYGSDYIFLQSRGLETHGDGTNQWNADDGSGFLGNGRYGLALPQMFVEIAHERLSVKVGHFYNMLGHEELIPTQNFYYTNTYSLFFNGRGESVPITGAFAQWRANDHWTLGGGFHRGQANWEDNNNHLNAIGMIEWRDCSGDMFLTFTFDVGKEDDLGRDTLYAQSLAFEWEFRERWGYTIHHAFGFAENEGPAGSTATWWGLTQHLAHDLTDRLTVGVRHDLFDDVDGSRVFPRAGGANLAPGVYQAVSLGANYRPSASVTIRPALRWDWFSADGPLPAGPFDNGTERSQFMAVADMIVTY